MSKGAARNATGSPWCCTSLDPGRAVQVSYNRLFVTRYGTPGGQDFFFSTEFPMIEFLEKNGYDVSYVSQSDVVAPGAALMLEQHKVFLNVGHSEYWDAGDRANVTAARDAGVNLAFFAGNLIWWKTRWATSQYGNESYRTLITYKESLDSAQSFNNADTVATFTPDSSLAAGTTYTATVWGAQNSSATAMSSPYPWSFSTSASVQCPCSIWQDAAPSGAVDAADTNAVNLGVRFQVASDGLITGIRFYKEADDTGSHTGSLWTAGGTLLANGTFSSESGSGWQELDFSTPVAVTARTTYVASYHTDTGHYAATQQGLASAVTNGPLTALAGGVYAYGSQDAFPSNSYNASNYWVDVVYSTS